MLEVKGLTSAAPLLAYLSEPEPILKSWALHVLNDRVALLWPEASTEVEKIEALCEDESFRDRELAALVASKVYYYLGEYDESMTLALSAGKYFEIDRPGEYENTILARCIETYIAQSASDAASIPNLAEPSSPLLTAAFPTPAIGTANTQPGLASPTTPFSQSTLPSVSLLSRQNSIAIPTAQLQIPGIPPVPSAFASRPLLLRNLRALIKRIFETCYQTGRYHSVIGIAVEARNFDVIRETILRAINDNKPTPRQGPTRKSANSVPAPADMKNPINTSVANKGEEIIEYTLDICMNLVQERSLRLEILRVIYGVLNGLPNPDYFAIAKCVLFLDQHEMACNLLKNLVKRGTPEALLTAYQISFDLYENGTQEFLSHIISNLPIPTSAANAQAGDTAFAVGSTPITTPNGSISETIHNGSNAAPKLVVSRIKSRELTSKEVKVYQNIQNILNGTKSIELHLEFLYRSINSDKTVLNTIHDRHKDMFQHKISIFHNSLTFANAFMSAGTTDDSFLRSHLPFLGASSCWSKFTATAALGVIHRGNITQGKNILDPYLPKPSSNRDSPPSEGGALYGLGLIYTNHGTHIIEYLRRHLLAEDINEYTRHGAALGLGLAAMATGSQSLYDDLFSTLVTYSDSAVSGEGIGIAMGLVMLGTGKVDALQHMIPHARDTQHEKIVRGIAVGMALVMYAMQDAADELIQGLLADADPILRYGGIMTIALAYCGTGSNKAVRKLLHVAVSDVSDNVRRVAVMSLGFVLFRKPSSVPRMVQLLAESYNPHVRYGAAMALGIACAGTGLDEAVDLLLPMMTDTTDFVRQGAYIALAMILIQQNESVNPKVAKFRERVSKMVVHSHEDAMAKFGCAVALGIIDAGGRNCTIGLQTPTGNLNMTAIVGMAIFTQYWFWFPLTHFLSLSFTPTAIIGIDQDLEIPKCKIFSNTKASQFDYPPVAEAKAEEAKAELKSAVLSTTGQSKRRKLMKERSTTTQAMDIDVPVASTAAKLEADTENAKKKASADKVGYEIQNMSRVLPAQRKHISFTDKRYTPIKAQIGSVVLLRDSRLREKKTLLELKVKKRSPPAQPRVADPKYYVIEGEPSAPVPDDFAFEGGDDEDEDEDEEDGDDEDEDRMDEA